MRTPAIPLVLTVALICACSGHDQVVSATPESTTDAVQSVCALPSVHARYDGQRVNIRGLFTAHAHGFLLRDEKCPGHWLFLRRTAGGPDTSLCTPERLVKEFGCPGGNDNGPIVTVSGILKPSTSPQMGDVLVDGMTDFQNVRTGARFNL